jgi:hypothetical protein
MGNPIPASSAAEKLVRGIEQRHTHVFAPGWTRVAFLSRGLVTPIDRFVHQLKPIAGLIKADR